MGTSILDDQRRALELIIAYLRLGCEEGGIRIGVKGGHALTPQLRDLVGRGDMAMLRADRSTNRLVHRVMTTPQGIDRLADYDKRYGPTFARDLVVPALRNDNPRSRKGR